ncbi:hypothetical protein ACVW1A_000311 [Bradyrhizobium sp. LB1.3]
MKMLSASLATQYGHAQIRCKAIAPGLVMTERLLAIWTSACNGICAGTSSCRASAAPRDVAALVAFLLYDDAAFITGQVVCIDGGMLAHVPTYADGRNSRAARPAGTPPKRPRRRAADGHAAQPAGPSAPAAARHPAPCAALSPWSGIFPPSSATCRACCGARNGRWAATSGWSSALPDT